MMSAQIDMLPAWRRCPYSAILTDMHVMQLFKACVMRGVDGRGAEPFSNVRTTRCAPRRFKRLHVRLQRHVWLGTLSLDPPR